MYPKPLILQALLMPALLMATPPSSRSETILVHGHRGARALRPENTIPAFRYAIDQGVDVLELDLAVTKDNVLVVSHSPFLINSRPGERVCTGPELPPNTAIRTLTLRQVRQYDCGSTTLARFPKQVAAPHTPVATFDEVLDLAQGNQVQFNVETKSFANHPELTPSPEEFVRMIDEAVRQHHLVNRVMLQSFDFRTLAAMKAIDPEMRRSALFGPAKEDALMGITDHDKDFVPVAKRTSATILSPDESLVTPEGVAAVHAMGVQVAPWTVDTEEGWRTMADAHVDAIITDDPAALLAWLRAQQPPLHP